MEETKPKSSKPVVAGVLNIIAGALNLLGALCLVYVIIIMDRGASTWSSSAGLGPMEIEIVRSVLIIVATFSIITGVLPLVGGIFAVQRRKWGLVLAGSIAAVFGSTILGIPALIFTALSREEFA